MHDALEASLTTAATGPEPGPSPGPGIMPVTAPSLRMYHDIRVTVPGSGLPE